MISIKQSVSAVACAAAMVPCISAHALTVNITPSNSIQAAIDQVHAAGGGTVNLSAGTYTIGSTTKIYSNITLNGAGIGSTVIQPPNASWQNELISDGTHGAGPIINNLTISNMTLNGLGMSAYNSMGIQICAAGSQRNTNITLRNLEIKNCAQGAGGPSNTDGLTITGCNFHANGYPVAGKTGLYYDNMYIRNDTNVQMSGSYFNDSPWGSGVKWTDGTSGTISITASNNALSGYVGQGTNSYITFLNCIFDSNHGFNPSINIPSNESGLQFAGTNCTVNGCYMRNNGGYGIRTWTGFGIVENCTSTGNGPTLIHYMLSPNYQLQAVSPATWQMINDM